MALTERDELELCRKLITDLHLSVPERKLLPRGHARFSILVAAVQEALDVSGWFPYQITPGQEIGSAAVLEMRDDAIWMHEQFEIGYLRYSPIQSTRFRNVPKAVRAFIERDNASAIDGVPVDWTA
jgi:hypothetical protein